MPCSDRVDHLRPHEMAMARGQGVIMRSLRCASCDVRLPDERCRRTDLHKPTALGGVFCCDLSTDVPDDGI